MAAASNSINRITNLDVVTTLDGTDPSRYMAVLTGEKHLIDLPLSGKVQKVYIDPVKSEKKE